MKLEQNYRSTQTILDAAHAVVSRNVGRKDKRLWTDRGGGTQITLFDAYNEYEEAEFVARQVEKLVGGRPAGRWPRLLTSRADDEDGTLRYGDIAVAYRINAQSRVIEESFMRFGIPYQLVGGTRFYERREVKDALAYLRLARNPGDRVALTRIINVPARGIGAKTLEELSAWAESRGVSLWQAVVEAGQNPNLAPRARAQLGVFADLMRGLMAMVPNEPPSAIFDAVVEQSGLSGRDPGRHRGGRGALGERPRAARPTRPSSTRSPRPRASPDSSRRWRSSATRTSSRTSPDRVTLITLHAAKGLEFPVVFIVGHGGGAAAAPARARGRA